MYLGAARFFHMERTGFRTRQSDWIISYSPEGAGWLYTIEPIESLSINERFPYWKVTKAILPLRMTIYGGLLFCLFDFVLFACFLNRKSLYNSICPLSLSGHRKALPASQSLIHVCQFVCLLRWFNACIEYVT